MNTHCPDHPAPRTLPLLVSLACLGMLGAAQAQPGPQAHATLPTVVVSSTQNNLLADDLLWSEVLCDTADHRAR